MGQHCRFYKFSSFPLLCELMFCAILGMYKKPDNGDRKGDGFTHDAAVSVH